MPKDVEIGNCQKLGTAEIPLNTVVAGLTGNPLKAQKLILETAFADKNISNSWNFWVYPAVLPAVDTAQIYIAENIDSQAKTVLDNGGKVLLLLNGKIVVCSFDLQSDLDRRIAARQLRYSILKYMNSNKFFPEKSIDFQLIENLTKKASENFIFNAKDYARRTERGELIF